MKKIILILIILLTSNIVFSQSAYYKKVSVKDSLYSAAGTLRINANAYYLDGVLQTFSGSSFDLTAFHLWTGINRFTNGTYFTDSVKFTGIAIVDSIKGNGSGLTSVDAITLKGQDTTHFARTDTLTTERVKSKTEFSDIVKFFLSPTIASIYQNASRTIQYFFPNSASDTLATISQTQTITNKTITGSTNTITGIKSGMIVVDPLVLTPVNDATNYYCGGFNNLAPTGTAGNQRLYFPTACTIKAVYVATYIIGSATSETVTAYIRKNNTTDSTIGTVAWSNASGYNNLSNYNMGVVLAQGDYIEFKFLTPTWATNPTSAYIVITFYFE